MRKSIVLLGTAALLLSGCWSRTEVTDLGVATGMAIDVGENAPVRVTLFLARGPGGQAEEQRGGGYSYWVVAREGQTISDAIRSISMVSARRLALHHLRSVLIGASFATKDMSDLMDFLARSAEIRMTTRVFLVQGNAQAALETQPQIERLQPENVAEILQAKGGPQPRLKEVLVARASNAVSAWFYALRVTTRPATTPATPSQAVEVSGAALLRGDRVVKVLDLPLTQALEWLDGNPKQSIFSASCPGAPDRHLSVRVLAGGVKIIPQWTGKLLSFRVAATGRVEILNTECDLNVLEPLERLSLERSLQDEMASRFQRLITVLQQTGTDPVAFGKRVQLQQTAYWRTIEGKWPQVWPKAPVKVAVEITIRDAGLLVAPANRTRVELQSEKQ